MFDYATLKIIWWFLISTLFILFFILGGRDFGVCMLLPLFGKNDDERRLILNSIGSTWEGNQVWFITAGGATFAAWPIVYATAFSGLYMALFLVLLALILRPPGFDFRSKLPSKKWRNMWDGAIFISGFVPALVFGVGLGNLLLGLPFHFDQNLQSHYEGSFFQLLNPLAVVFGLCSVLILALHGGLFLQKKLPLTMVDRVRKWNALFAVGFLALFVLLGYWSNTLKGFRIESIGDVQKSLIPLTKQVSVVTQGWLANYVQTPNLWALPISAIVAGAFAFIATLLNRPTFGILMSSLAILSALLTVNAALFPFILPSSSVPNHSITLWDATSSHKTLQYMFWATIVFLPIILCYTTWVFRVMRGRQTSETAELLKKTESY